MIEARLIERVLDGDDAAARELYDAHVDRVYRLAYRMAGDEDLAREFTQASFIRAFERLHQFRGDAALSTWLHSITVSVTLNGLRKVKRAQHREVELDEAVPGRTGPPAEPDLRQRLHRAVDGLPEIYRSVFVMHDVEGYTHDEIGQTLDVATGTSKARLFRARRMLRDELADFAEEYVV
ncbi:MAG: sigma-70 family RNA polymerase sigma factor [Gemmatimonadetes bacterium]|nr:sigma-70 family RNA polymerase sigma factor [Gemmatimonadota bacterium]